MSFGRRLARLTPPSKPSVTFVDVAGVDEAKEELAEIVDFLKYRERFQPSVGVSLGAFSWLVLLEQVKRFLPGQLPEKPECLSSPSVVLNL